MARSAPLLVALLLGGVRTAGAQTFQIGVIDFYGLHRVSEDEARAALAFAEGDTLSLAGGGPPTFLAESERRLEKLPGVVRARTNVVCCNAGRLIIYVGVEEEGAPTMRTRPAPRSTVRLSPDVIQAGDEFAAAFVAAVQRGDAGEDDSRGHALSRDPATRAIQERFVVLAARDREQLRRVLRESSAAEQRALAAQVLGYVVDKQGVVDDLVHAMTDSSHDVRNNAMRALVVFRCMTPTATQTIPSVPFDPFVALLNSPIWTDRNKSSVALMKLSEGRDPGLLAQLRKDAMEPLLEMARWKDEGHAMPAFMILGRMAGLTEEALQTAWSRGEREGVLNAAIDTDQ